MAGAKHATNGRARAPYVMLFAGLIVVAGVGTAAADERVVLVLDATGDEDGRAMVQRFERSLGPDPVLDPVPVRFREALAAPTSTDTGWTASEARVAEARKLLTAPSYAAARQEARAAQDELARHAGDPAARALLAEAVMIEGLAVAGESGAEAARPLFGLVHRLVPGQKLDPGRYLPDVVRVFDAAARSGASGKLVIDASGAEQILVDGTVVSGEKVVVAAGPHIVTARGERIDPQGRRVEALPAKDVLVILNTVEAPAEVLLGRARDRLVAATDDRQRVDAISAMLGKTRALYAVVIVREGGDGGELATRVYTPAGGLGPPRPIDNIPAALTPLRPIDSKPRGAGGGGAVVMPVRPPAEKEWWQKSWFKATSGTVVAAAAVTLITLVVTRDPGDSTFKPPVDVE
jgi:hypothetical protein